MRKNGFTLIELLVGIAVSVVIFMITSSLIVALLHSSTNQRRMEDLEQTKNDLRIDLGNSINWADNVSFENNTLTVDNNVYKLENGRITKNGAFLTGKDVNIDSWNIYKHSTESAPVEVSAGSGLLGRYYNDRDFTDYVFDRVDPVIDFDWNTDSPDPAIDPDTFSISWTGQVETEDSGEYIFYTRNNDGVELWVNDEKIIDNMNDGTRINTAPIRLDAETRYNIRLNYYNNLGDSEVHLYWRHLGVNEIIPVNKLYPNELQSSLEIVIDLSHQEAPQTKDNLRMVLSPRGNGVVGVINTVLTPTPTVTIGPEITDEPTPTDGPFSTAIPTPYITNTPRPTRIPTPTTKPLP